MKKDVKGLFSDLDKDMHYNPGYDKSYMIAMTPRSGSSYLTDVLSRTMLLGRPGEFLPYEHIKIAMDKLGRNKIAVQDHFLWVIRQTSTNGVFGQKSSYYQAQQFFDWDGFNVFDYLFPGTKFIYLIRRAIVKQAISLYIATETKVFHTNVEHERNRIKMIESLPYNRKKINYWLKHIVNQEILWSRYFKEKGIDPLFFYYEDLVADVEFWVNKIISYVGVEGAYVDPKASIFRPVSTNRNIEFYELYANDSRNIDELESLGVPQERV